MAAEHGRIRAQGQVTATQHCTIRAQGDCSTSAVGATRRPKTFPKDEKIRGPLGISAEGFSSKYPFKVYTLLRAVLYCLTHICNTGNLLSDVPLVTYPTLLREDPYGRILRNLSCPHKTPPQKKKLDI